MRIAGKSWPEDGIKKRAVISLFFSCFLHIIEIIRHSSRFPSHFIFAITVFCIFPIWKVGACRHFGWLFPVKSLPDPFPAPPNTRNRSSRLSHVTLFTHFLLLCFENRSKARGGTNRLAFREQTDRVTIPSTATDNHADFMTRFFRSPASSLVKRHAINSLLVCISARNRV